MALPQRQSPHPEPVQAGEQGLELGMVQVHYAVAHRRRRSVEADRYPVQNHVQARTGRTGVAGAPLARPMRVRPDSRTE